MNSTLLSGLLIPWRQRAEATFSHVLLPSSLKNALYFHPGHAAIYFSVFQKEFIQFCKTLYSMFHEDPEENNLYQAIATVTTLLLQIGEVGQHSSSSSSRSCSQDSGEGPRASAPSPEQDSVFMDTDTGTAPQNTRAFPEEAEGDWTISLEHILASLLTEQSLVNFFEKPLDIKSKLENAKINQYNLKTFEMSSQSLPELKQDSDLLR